MDAPRISSLLGSDLPTGRVVVYRPRAGADLSIFGDATVEVIQSFKPDHDAFAAMGLTTRLAAEGEYDLAVVCVPRSKIEARGLIADAAARARRVIVDGQKTDGIDSLLRDIKKHGAEAVSVSKSHGKAISFTGGDFADWTNPGPMHVVDGFTTRAGVFSAERVDAASRLLVENLPDKLPAVVADLGAGWGYLSRHILSRDGVARLHVVEAEHNALLCARENVADPRATFHWADATTVKLPEIVDAVVMNPPFHTTREGDPGLGQAFIGSAARLLSPRGTLWLVANRHLPYEATLGAHFADVTEVTGVAGFKVLRAAKPLRRGGRNA
ncbi:class I SAM-dependent methyltransferase [Celeribacter arenosi]|uniref:Class I SAM-dependent methyltransferase n=1 Tax=Celeribacter arenosi TaxID=792649 RepID=A0ABP7K199_9RHOB